MRVTISVIIKTTLVLLLVFFSTFAIYLFCDYLVNWIILNKCDWPEINSQSNKDGSSLQVMFITDTHLMGTQRTAWPDRIYRDWCLYWAFQTAITLYKPEVVFILGDILDEGWFSTDEEFEVYMTRFHSVFSINQDDLKMYVVVGNHDIGLHNEVIKQNWLRFNRVFETKDARIISIKGIHFVHVNSMGFLEDDCFLCSSTERQVKEVEAILKCSSTEWTGSKCNEVEILEDYSKPILLQHYHLLWNNRIPLPNKTDQSYNPLISQPILRGTSNRTMKLLDQIQPRASFTGHTHFGYTTYLFNRTGIEHSLPSFNRRMNADASLTLAVFTKDDYSMYNCPLPTIDEVFTATGITISLLIIFIGLINFYCKYSNRSKEKQYNIP